MLKKLLLVLAIALPAFLITSNYLQKEEARKKLENEAVQVVIAKAPIAARTTIIADMLEYRRIPRNYVIPGAIGNISDAINKISMSPIVVGEQIIANKLIVRSANVGLSLVIPKNKRAVSVQVDSTASIAGMVKPGDMVDIVCVLQELDRTLTILQNVQILAIDQQVIANNIADNSKINSSVIATFALNLEDAEKLIQASNIGTLKLLLRPLDDVSRVFSWGANTSKVLPGHGVDNSYSVRVISGAEVSTQAL